MVTSVRVQDSSPRHEHKEESLYPTFLGGALLAGGLGMFGLQLIPLTCWLVLSCRLQLLLRFLRFLIFFFLNSVTLATFETGVATG